MSGIDYINVSLQLNIGLVWSGRVCLVKSIGMIANTLWLDALKRGGLQNDTPDRLISNCTQNFIIYRFP